MLLVVTHLGTAIGVWESRHIFYGSAYEALSLTLNGLGNVIDTAYSGDDPDLVADADFSVRPAVTVKEAFFRWRGSSFLFVVGVGEQIAQPGL